jgi:transposase InsO family protein
MQTKSQVPDLFRNFVASLKTQHNVTVRVLRSDNGGEYIGREFQEWLSKMGIRHETSAPYTPQQVYKQFLFHTNKKKLLFPFM